MLKSDMLKDSDGLLILSVLLIFVISMLSLYSASYQPDGGMARNYAWQQLLWLAVSIGLILVIIFVGYERVIDYAYIIYAVNLLLLLTVLLVGSSKMGARRWLDIGSFTLQPSEFCKISFILALTKYIGDNHYRLDNLKAIIGSILLCIIPMVLIIKQPDLGTALVFLPILLVVLFAAGIRVKYVISFLLTGLAGLPMLWFILKDYQKQRLFVFLNPNADPLGAGYTIIQSKIAVGSGGLSGKGWLAGTQNLLNFLTERHTDFIFSVIGEEWGFAGSVLIIVLFAILLSRLVRIASSTNDFKAKIIIVAIVTLFWFQIFVNIAMTIGIMPVVGLPLPLISYGGSSLITTMILLGLAFSVANRRKIF